MLMDLRRDMQLCDGSVIKRAFAVALGLAFAALGGAATAAPINHGSFVGTDVTYVDVTEDSNSGDIPPLFGAPTVSANSLDFTPVGFSASASGAGGVDITDGNLAFMVVAKPGKAIQNIKMTEAGDTTMAGNGNDNTITSVTGQGILNINEVDGVSINTIALPIDFSYTPSGGSFGLGTDGGGGPNFNSLWSGVEFLDIQQILVSNNIPFNLGATKVSVNFNNTLVAVSQAGTSALIAKKDHIIITTNVPEPTTCVIALIGLIAGVAAIRRKR